MKVEKRTHWSYALEQEMQFNVYGDAGKPIILFPFAAGEHQAESDAGIIEGCRDLIERGIVRLYTLGSYDHHSWLDEGKSPAAMAWAQNNYEHYIIDELTPLIRHECHWYGRMALAGCSLGAFHTVNFALKYPDLFDVAIALSGVYDARFFTGKPELERELIAHSPLDYLHAQNDAWYLNHYRTNHYIIAVGQGAWEGQFVANTRQLQQLFENKGIEAWFDYWGCDIDHGLSTWRRQLPYYLNTLLERGAL